MISRAAGRVPIEGVAPARRRISNQLNTMTPQTARTLSATTFVAAIVTLVLLGCARCPLIQPYIAAVILAVMSAFVGSTQDS